MVRLGVLRPGAYFGTPLTGLHTMMNQHTLSFVFPSPGNLPPQAGSLPSVWIHRILRDGALLPWDGPMTEVRSPIPLSFEDGIGLPVIGSLPAQTGDSALEALASAQRAYDHGRGPWPAAPLAARAAAVMAFLTALEAQRKDFVPLMMWEVAKPLQECDAEFERSLEYGRDTVSAALDMQTREDVPQVLHDVVGRIERTPIGVALVTGPYNYPLYETLTNLVPALLMGNTCVLKPPPHGGLLMGLLQPLLCAHFPPGAVNLVFGAGDAVLPPLMRDGGVDVFAFIGTSAVAAALIREHPAPHRLHLLLGLEAKNAAIVLPGADLHRAAAECLKGALAYSGQRCAAIKMVFVHVAEERRLLAIMQEQLTAVRTGLPWDEVRVTPVITPEHAAYLTGLLEDAQASGAHIVNSGGGSRAWTLMTPALLSGVTTGMRIAQEEQFGPIVPVIAYREIAEVDAWLAASRFGQQVSLFGGDARLLAAVTEQCLRSVGRVNINSKCQRGPDHFPFTGRRDSALGSVSIEEALDRFSIKTVVATPAHAEDLALWDALRPLR
jgi:glyceraldehyde-3-phosphate dehydrogenase (NADP+)